MSACGVVPRCLLGALLAAVGLGAPPNAVAALPVVRIDGPRVIPDASKASARLQMPGYRGRVAIERRGQSSQQFPKKSYSIELRNAKGDDRKVALLGMPADGDWVLYAAYNDKTLLRNAVAYDTARAFGRYAPRTRFVELHLNRRYHGVYVLTEKVELGGDRVGGEALLEFTFPFQARSKNPSFTMPIKRRPVVWEDPERGDLTSAQANAIAARVRAAERALYRGGSWREHIDEAAAVDYVLLQELFKNQDAFHASTYVTLQPDGKLHFGPAWDFDISGGNSTSGLSQYSTGWILARRQWAERLYRDAGFEQRLAERWRELRAAGLRRDVLDAIARNQAALRGALNRNFQRWPILDRGVWPNARARGSHTAEVRFLRLWLSRRISWIDRNIDGV